jgi:putative alpha-1,2-mannosidase
MYHYVNKPGLSTQRSRQVIAQFFNTSRNGLPGNDGQYSLYTPKRPVLKLSPFNIDSGAMGSYVAFYLAGLYPLPGTRQILLSSPYFREISFYNPLYKSTTTIRSTNFVGNPKDGTGGWVFVKVRRSSPFAHVCMLTKGCLTFI